MGFFKRFKKPKASVSLAIPKSTAGLGEDLKGAITVSCEEEFDATEVRAELRCIEKRRRERWVYNERRRRNVRQVYWDNATLHSSDPKASGRVHIVPGFKKTFPIKGVVAIDGRPDVTSDTIELQVVRPVVAPGAVKEREVVMVPCEYCGTMMPETATSCPNCGAPRKA